MLLVGCGADAGKSRNELTGLKVTLDASNSRGKFGGKLTYKWKQIGGYLVDLNNTTSKKIMFTAPSKDDYKYFSDPVEQSSKFMLTVTELRKAIPWVHFNEKQETYTDSVTITYIPNPKYLAKRFVKTYLENNIAIMQKITSKTMIAKLNSIDNKVRTHFITIIRYHEMYYFHNLKALVIGKIDSDTEIKFYFSWDGTRWIMNEVL